MRSLREHVRDLQLVEQAAAEKVGLRFALLKEDRLFKGKAGEYMDLFIERMQIDIFPELVEAAKLGMELNSEIREA
jgi:hypothetical protein